MALSPGELAPNFFAETNQPRRPAVPAVNVLKWRFGIIKVRHLRQDWKMPQESQEF
jgi:hypothetical protein